MKEMDANKLEGVVGGANINYISHVVQPGEDAVKIGNQHGVAWQQLKTRNNQPITNPTGLKKGDVVLIPVKGQKG